jgi:ABC-type multidrug transport system ATPase subunit
MPKPEIGNKFYSKTEVLKNTNSNEIFSLLGKNGAGKNTLISVF